MFIKRRLFVRFLQIQILRELSERAELFWPTQIKYSLSIKSQLQQLQCLAIH